MSTSLRDPTEVTPASPSRIGRRVGVVLLVGAAMALLVGVGVVAKRQKDPVGQLRVRDGEVDVRHTQEGFVRASDGDPLGSGDGVQTGGDGQAQVDYFEGSVTRLDARTTLLLTALTNDRNSRVSVSLEGGRVWNRVKDAAFTMRMTGATASAQRATFALDCRTSGRCYAIGVDGTTTLNSTSGQRADVEAGDCETVLSDGSLERCDARRAWTNDQWIRENLAEDQQLALAKTTPTPSPTPTESASTDEAPGPVFHAPAPQPAARPTPRTPTKTAPPSTPQPTKDHNDDGVISTPSITKPPK